MIRPLLVASAVLVDFAGGLLLGRAPAATSTLR